MKNKKRNAGKVRYAVVGLGHLAQVAVLPAFAHLQNAEIAALVTGDKRKAAVLARRYRVKNVYDYDQYEECLADDIDAVYIVLPNHQHCEFTSVLPRPVLMSCVKSPWRSASRNAVR